MGAVGPKHPLVHHFQLLFDVLHLFPQLLDQHLELDRDVGHADVHGFGAERIGFAVEFLHQEIEPPADGAGLAEHAVDLGKVRREAINFLGDVGFLREQDDLLLKARGVELLFDFFQARIEPR